MPATSHKCETAKLNRLAGSIYDAALDPALWTDVLAAIADFVGGQAAGLVTKDYASQTLSPDYLFGVDPLYICEYSENYGKHDPLTAVPNFDIAQVVSIPELAPYKDYLDGTFYQEWVRPQGWGDVANAVVDKSAKSCAILAVIRTRASGLVDDEMRRRMALVVPYVRRAVLVRNVIDRKQSEIATFAATFDGLSAGSFFVDAAGRIVHTNAAGETILREDDYLRSVGGRLIARNAKANETLQETFAAAEKDTEIGSKGIALPLVARDGECHVAHVLPLTPRARESAGIAYTASAAVFVRKAAMDGLSPPDVIGKTYELTPAELRVLLAIVQEGGISDVAESLGIADTTVKTHLRRLFEKTGTGRQADLIKLVAGFASPLLMG